MKLTSLRPFLVSFGLLFCAGFSPEPNVEAGVQRAATTSRDSPDELTDEQIKKILIDESIANYSGNCPCPYSRAKNGSLCGKRSAYSRPGGESPLCYPKDVTKAMIEAYRAALAK